MKKNVIDRERLKSILLNHLYSKGNVAFLMEHTVLTSAVAARELDKECVTLDIYLNSDHWAFKHGEEPRRRYVVDVVTDDKIHVLDATQNEVVGIFFNYNSAAAYMRMMNKQ